MDVGNLWCTPSSPAKEGQSPPKEDGSTWLITAHVDWGLVHCAGHTHSPMSNAWVASVREKTCTLVGGGGLQNFAR
jgi:hypothetical protein